ncbi:hypothetical protein [Pedobacter sp. D749]|uniref:hypothetical protein n=1 Tax=Pedobacter sp. D749 TaxID=2856523 RepID=UPI001C5A170E|nr:hypothetical protein [Pedobacter sp. D749]QXU41468.1 hypothetical protein KYH19_21090 [Pedobacter sp. D749]
MTNEERDEFLSQIDNDLDIENIHRELKALSKVDAKQIVDAMSERKIDLNVSVRRFQEDYIADYIEFLWDISKTSFWKHVIISLSIENGLLWSDNMFHFERLCDTKLPEDVWYAVMDFAVNADDDNKQDLDTIACVIRAQCLKFNREKSLRGFIRSCPKESWEITTKRIDKMIITPCTYSF